MQNKLLKELKTKTREQLEKEVLEKKAELVIEAANLSAGRVKNVRKVKAGRVHIARIKTILHEMQISADAKAVVDKKEGVPQ